MHHVQPKTCFLHRYDTDLGLWAHTELDSPVSRPILEAMNAILSRDGILAYIGQKSEFGQYLTELEDRREANSTDSWTSLPGVTLYAILGLCQNPSTAERRSLVFHGSPRTLALSHLISLELKGEGSSHWYSTNFLLNYPDWLLYCDLDGLYDSKNITSQSTPSSAFQLTEGELQDLYMDFALWCYTRAPEKFPHWKDAIYIAANRSRSLRFQELPQNRIEV